MNRLPLACAAGLLLCATAAPAQSIDPTPARATLGQPLAMTLRMRAAAGWPALRPACVQAELVMGDTLLDADAIDVEVAHEPASAWQRVQLSHRAAITEPVLEVRVAIVCGPPFRRSFTVLAEAAGARGGAAAPAAAAPFTAARLPSRVREVRSPPEPARAAAAPPARAVAAATGSALAAPAPAAVPDPADALLLTSVAAPRPAAPAIAPSAASPRESYLLEELARLRGELQRLQTSLSAVQARAALAQEATTPWLWAFVGVASGWLATVVMGALARLGGRTLRTALPRSAASPRWRREPPPVAVEAAPVPVPRVAADLPADPPRAAARAPSAVPPAPPMASERAQRYTHADFGQASLDDPPPPQQLREIEQLVSDGFHGGAVALLEHLLQKHAGKDPWLLLYLFDLYRDMGQPWNQERVAAQLEVLYNVHLPPLESADVEGAGLDALPQALAALQQHWGKTSCLEVLASLLLPGEPMPRIGLAAFRDALLLHAIVRAQRPDDDAAVPFDPLIDWAPPP